MVMVIWLLVITYFQAVIVVNKWLSGYGYNHLIIWLFGYAVMVRWLMVTICLLLVIRDNREIKQYGYNCK